MPVDIGTLFVLRIIATTSVTTNIGSEDGLNLLAGSSGGGKVVYCTSSVIGGFGKRIENLSWLDVAVTVVVKVVVRVAP